MQHRRGGVLYLVLSGAPAPEGIPQLVAMCQSLANPMVAAATAAAMGALTPMPCIPMTTAPWVVGAPTVLLDGMPSLNDSSKLICNWGGVIQITFPGQTKVIDS